MKKLVMGLAVVFLFSIVVACAKAPSPAPPVPPPTTVPPATTAVPRGVPAPTIIIPAPMPPGAADGKIITPVPAPTPRPAPVPGPVPAPAPVYPGAAASQPADIDRMIVRTGQMSLLVEDIAGSIDRIVTLTDTYKGYVVSSNTWREGERLRGMVSIRVPVADFDNVIKAVAALASEVTQQTTSSRDVTEEYTDLSSRLKNLEATEQQLLRIMEKATKIEDVLAIQRELTNTRNQIEQTKGRIQYLERTSATSLLNINLEQAKLEVKFNTTGGRVAQVGDAVRFISQIVGGFAPYSYQWDFGDRDTSTEVAPAHAYKAAGNYTVSLKVTDSRGNTDIETTQDYITIIPVPSWNAGNVAASAWNALGSFGRGMANVLIWLGVFSPVWIVGGVIAYWAWHRRKQKKA